LRLFLALRPPEPDLDVLEAWQAEQLPGDVRIVPRGHLHVTLAFLGHRPRLTPVRYRETRSVGMLVLDDEGGRAEALADDLQTRLEGLGVYRRERRNWLPHLTVARFRQPEGLRPDLPKRGTYVLIPSDASAYLSRLRPGGAQYDVLDSVALGTFMGGQ
jgi:2'-5' RNA ligase